MYKRQVLAIALTPSADALAVAGDDGHVRVFAIVDGALRPAPFVDAKVHGKDGASEKVTSIAWAPRRTGVLATASKDGTTRILHIAHKFLATLAASDKAKVKELCVLNVASGLPAPPPVRKNGPPGQYMCRAAVWGGADGDLVYTVSSAVRGDAFVSCWAPDMASLVGSSVDPKRPCLLYTSPSPRD